MTTHTAPSAVNPLNNTLPQETTLGRVTFRVRDLDAMVAFYTAVLGMDVIERGDFLAPLDDGFYRF